MSWRVPGRRVLVALLVVGGVGALVVTGIGRVRTDTTASAFLPAGDPTLVALDEAARAFGGDPIVVLAESAQPGALLREDQLERLVGLEGELARLPDVAVVYGPGTVLNQLADAARDLLATVSGRRDLIARQYPEALADYDRRYGSLMVAALPAGLPTLRNPRFAQAVIFDESGNPRPRWRFVVPAPDAVAILVRPREGLDQQGTERLTGAVRAAVGRSGLDTRRLTVSGTPVVFADLGETVRREIPLLGALALGLIAACYLLVPWTKPVRRRLVPLLVTLGATAVTVAAFGWFGLPLSLGVVAFLPILLGIGSDFPAYTLHGVSRRLVLVTGLASAAGFASLALSPLPFVRGLGVALAVGVLVAVGLGLLVQRVLRPVAAAEPAAPELVSPPAAAAQSAGAGAAASGRGPRRRRRAVLGALAALAVLGWVALPHIAVQARPDALAAGLPSIADAHHAERVIGSSGEVQVLLRGPDVAAPAALAWMRQAEAAIVLAHGDDLRRAVSLPDLLGFLGTEPTPEHVDAAFALLPHYLRAAVINDDRTQAAISFGVRLNDVDDQAELLAQVRAALPPPPAGMTADLVGLPVAAARGYQLADQDRYLANGCGLLAAGLVLLMGLRRRSDAGRAVLAAVLAAGWGLAAVWAMGIPLSPLSLALGSLSTATACEFTVLLSRAGSSVRRTVWAAALAAALGYLALGLSRLAVLADFGLLLAGCVGLSLLAAHAVTRLLPAAPLTSSDAAPRRHDLATHPRELPDVHGISCSARRARSGHRAGAQHGDPEHPQVVRQLPGAAGARLDVPG